MYFQGILPVDRRSCTVRIVPVGIVVLRKCGRGNNLVKSRKEIKEGLQATRSEEHRITFPFRARGGLLVSAHGNKVGNAPEAVHVSPWSVGI